MFLVFVIIATAADFGVGVAAFVSCDGTVVFVVAAAVGDRGCVLSVVVVFVEACAALLLFSVNAVVVDVVLRLCLCQS